MASQKIKALETYKKMLVVFAAVTVLVSFLLSITGVLFPIIALALALLPWFLWNKPMVRKCTRIAEIVLLAAPLLLLAYLAIHGMQNPEYPFDSEYLWVLSFSQVVLPCAAVAAVKDEKEDMLLMRVIACLYAVETAVVCVLYFCQILGWFELLLYAACALVMLVLPFMIHPLELARFSKKTIKELRVLKEQYENDEITKKEYTERRKEIIKGQ